MEIAQKATTSASRRSHCTDADPDPDPDTTPADSLLCLCRVPVKYMNWTLPVHGALTA